jgi:hypothetical protein
LYYDGVSMLDCVVVERYWLLLRCGGTILVGV